MERRRELGHERRKSDYPKSRAPLKRTAFSVLAVAMPLLAQPGQAQAITRKDITFATIQRSLPRCAVSGRDVEIHTPDGATMRIRNALEKTEKLEEVVCHENNAYVRTNTSLISIFHGWKDTAKRGGFLLPGEPPSAKTDLRNIYAREFVSWIPAGNIGFFLTRDRTLTRIELDKEGNHASGIRMPLDVSHAMLEYENGFVLIAPSEGKMMAVSYDGSVPELRRIPLPRGMDNAGFRRQNDSLLLVSGTEAWKVRISGPSVNYVGLERTNQTPGTTP